MSDAAATVVARTASNVDILQVHSHEVLIIAIILQSVPSRGVSLRAVGLCLCGQVHVDVVAPSSFVEVDVIYPFFVAYLITVDGATLGVIETDTAYHPFVVEVVLGIKM